MRCGCGLRRSLSGRSVIEIEKQNTSIRIFGDFKCILSSSRRKDFEAIPLNRFGSLCDLSRQGLVLSEGLTLTVFDSSDESEDLEADVVVYFDEPFGTWVGEFFKGSIRHVPTVSRPYPELECFNCHKDLQETIEKYGLNEKTVCPTCGELSHTPILRR
jgi:hypothetical protein